MSWLLREIKLWMESCYGSSTILVKKNAVIVKFLIKKTEGGQIIFPDIHCNHNYL